MSDDFGTGVSRVLDPGVSSFLTVIWKEGKPPLDSELNLLQQMAAQWNRQSVLAGVPSGWLGNDTNASHVFTTNKLWSNWFRFGRNRTGEVASVLWAVVNGWVIPITGTQTGTPPGSPNDTDPFNVVTLDPPPANSGDFRTDFVFLEVWKARVAPSPSTLNKPSSSALFRHGNVESGQSYVSDDLVDPAIGFETTQRVQLQYRIRVVKGISGLAAYPDGFDPASVKAQGAAASPTSYTFANMRETLGDPGLWRAGDGTSNSLGTVDGYVYAIPISAVFRRNGAVWNGDPSQNLNGAFNRNPTAIDRTGVATFSTIPTLAANLTAAATTLTLASVTNIPLPLSPATPVLVQVGDEMMTYTAITGTTMSGLTRGVNGTRAEAHVAGDAVNVHAGRPDGLFADQVALTDILDLRHVVSPTGFDYQGLLHSNLDKLLRGQLRANWKRSGAGPQGPFVFYQDKITDGTAALGVTQIDAPDNIRQVFSDAVVTQPIEIIVKPNNAAVPAAVNEAWSLNLTATHTVRATPAQFSPNDVLEIPVAQLKNGLPAGDTDQVRFLNDGVVGAVSIRIDGQTDPVPASLYTVTPANPTEADDLTITLGASFPVVLSDSQLYITLHVMYGAGRGLSRRPDAVHAISFLSPSTELLVRPSGVPSTNYHVSTSWAPLWNKYRNDVYKGQLPVAASTYADLGSKTVVLAPFRRIDWPDTLRTMDGTAANYNAATVTSGTTGIGAASATFQDLSANFTAAGVSVGDAIVLSSGPQPGRYTVLAVAPGGDNTKLTLERSVPTGTNISYSVHTAQGLMPLLASDGVTPKWTSTDPLGMFSGTTEATAATKNIYVTLPRHLMPGWGAYYVPMLTSDTAVFAEGVNFMCNSVKGAAPFTDDLKNFIPYSNGPLTYGIFSTLDLNPPGTIAATYNGSFAYGGNTFAGIRKYTDTRGLGRQGLELPPFYGVARLFAVYEAQDYKTNGSAYDASTRNSLGGAGATNLLRQSFDGPTFWVELDEDGDSTFILNADILDLARSPNPIASFAAGHFVVEASLFGFDRGSFDVTKEFRLVMTRPTSPTLMRSEADDTVTRANNIGVNVTAPTSVIQGPASTSEQVLVSYSRTPYQGDAFGSQTTFVDIGYYGGPLLTANAWQLVSTQLNEEALTRPNEKPLEILASLGFATTLGTGRLSGDTVSNPLDFRSVGYEDPATYPPSSAIDDRPNMLPDHFASDSPREVGTEYLGCTERLPLGALLRDKDFRGGQFSASGDRSPLVFYPGRGIQAMSSLSPVSTEVQQADLHTASVASGAPGETVVAVDGEQGNYALLTNFRTTRGGSAYAALDPAKGGELATAQPEVMAPASHTHVLSGRAYLVRNARTSVGVSEVSAGGELMMLVVTNAQSLEGASPEDGVVAIGTNGTREGYAAADIYRIEGHPLVANHTRSDLDPSQISLSKRG